MDNKPTDVLPMDDELSPRDEMDTVESTSADASLPSMKGNVESCIGRTLFGWIHDSSQPVRRLTVQAYSGNTLAGTACADVYREDLKQAGIGDGRYGFELELDDCILGQGPQRLSVVERDSRQGVGSIELTVAHYATSHIEAIDSASVTGYLVLETPNDCTGFNIDLCIDDEVAANTVCRFDPDKGRYVFSIAVPSLYFDDCFHLFSVRLTGYVTDAIPYLEKLYSNITPWKFLSRDIQSGQLSALSKVAGYRYKSLQNALRCRRQDEGANNAFDTLMLAHDVLVEGYEDRRNFPRLTLPACSNPLVSIIIPVHDKFELTYHCAASLILNAGTVPFEVIVVDDLSSDRTVDIDSFIDGVRVVRNTRNLGFLLSVEAGAEAAQGEYLLLLNNDTEVTSGWLEALLATFETFNNVGMAGAKLIYPTGKLQEAGGVVWGNGQPWNIGNRQNAADPVYNYVRSADYLSGAALMLRKSVWEQVGGFSKEFAPAYYEDTDLAFKVRDAGYRTLYCPASTVIHFEGMSNGTELNAGIKRFQSINAPRFRSNWRHHYRHHGQVGMKNLIMELDRDADFHVLVVDHSTPKPDYDAGGYAVTQEIMLMQELGCKVTFIPNNMAHMGTYTQALQDSGVECIYAPFYRSVGDYLQQQGHRYDLVYIIRYDVAEQILPSVKEFTGAKTVLNNCDLHFLREIRAALVKKNRSLEGPLTTRDRELSVMRTVDAVLSYNEVEHSVITSHNLRDENIFKCPWVLTSKRSEVPFEERDGIAFLGGFNHTPNLEAIEYFTDEVMPLLADSAPHIKLYVYGSNMPASLEAMASDQIIIKGYVESLQTVFDQCRIFVAPLLSGAGIKGKVLESIAFGVPSILSPVAAESTGLMHGSSTFIARSREDWVDCIMRLYDDQKLWCKLSDATQDVLASEYDLANGLAKMTELFEYLELEPSRHRSALFSRNSDAQRDADPVHAESRMIRHA